MITETKRLAGADNSNPFQSFYQFFSKEFGHGVTILFSIPKLVKDAILLYSLTPGLGRGYRLPIAH